MESTLSLNLLFCNCSASFYCVFGIHITCCSGKRLYWLIRQISSMILTQVFVLLWIDHKSLSLVCVQWIYEESIEFQNSIKKHKRITLKSNKEHEKHYFHFFFPFYSTPINHTMVNIFSKTFNYGYNVLTNREYFWHFFWYVIILEVILNIAIIHFVPCMSLRSSSLYAPST